MRNALLMSAGLLCLAAAPALAQNATITTQTPPAPNAQSFTPAPGVSVPSGSATATTPRPGDDVSTMRTTPRAAPVARQPGAAAMGTVPVADTDRGMTGMRPMRGQQHHHGMHHGDGMHHGGASAGAGVYDGDGGQGRVPASTRASNTGARGTRGEIAPRLPDPNVDSNSPESFLAAAERAIRARQTGRAQEALERAETRLLTRSVEAGMADTPANSPAVQHIGEARRALGRGDRTTALQLIQAAQANAGAGAGMGMQGAGMGQGMGMSGGQMGGMGMGHGMGTSGGQMGGMGQGMGVSGGQMGGAGMGMGQGMGAPGNVGSQGQSMGAQGVGAPVSGTVR